MNRAAARRLNRPQLATINGQGPVSCAASTGSRAAINAAPNQPKRHQSGIKPHPSRRKRAKWRERKENAMKNATLERVKSGNKAAMAPAS